MDEQWLERSLCSGKVKVEPKQVIDISDRKGLIVFAVTSLQHMPKMTEKKLIVIPDRDRHLLEQHIEHYGNLISVNDMVERRISSLSPSVALIPECSEDEVYLSEAIGFLGTGANLATTSTQERYDLISNVNKFRDRLDGIALYAEALCHTHRTGRFHEHIRLLERGFGLSGRSLIRPLSEYLPPSMGYTSNEVERWIGIRDAATHADKRNQIVFENDISWILGRIEQASYDVLINKANWRKPDVARRGVWVKAVATCNSEFDFYGTRGVEWKLEFQMFDYFRRFPLHATASLASLPDKWWSGPFLLKDGTLAELGAGGVLHVVDNPSHEIDRDRSPSSR
jgi:hypothetical protein